MANNRLWLIHRPTGEAVLLGKRMAVGWYSPGDISAFFNAIEVADQSTSQDDFILAIEDASGAPCCTAEWEYGPEHRPVLKPPAKG